MSAIKNETVTTVESSTAEFIDKGWAWDVLFSLAMSHSGGRVVASISLKKLHMLMWNSLSQQQ